MDSKDWYFAAYRKSQDGSQAWRWEPIFKVTPEQKEDMERKMRKDPKLTTIESFVRYAKCLHLSRMQESVFTYDV